MSLSAYPNLYQLVTLIRERVPLREARNFINESENAMTNGELNGCHYIMEFLDSRYPTFSNIESLISEATTRARRDNQPRREFLQQNLFAHEEPHYRGGFEENTFQTNTNNYNNNNNNNRDSNKDSGLPIRWPICIALFGYGFFFLLGGLYGFNLLAHRSWPIDIDDCNVVFTPTEKIFSHHNSDGDIVSGKLIGVCEPEYLSESYSGTISCWVNPRKDDEAFVTPDWELAPALASTILMFLILFASNIILLILFFKFPEQKITKFLLVPFFIFFSPIVALYLMYKNNGNKRYIYGVLVVDLIFFFIIFFTCLYPVVKEKQDMIEGECKVLDDVDTTDCFFCKDYGTFGSCEKMLTLRTSVYRNYQFGTLSPTGWTDYENDLTIYKPVVALKYGLNGPSTSTGSIVPCLYEKDYVYSPSKKIGPKIRSRSLTNEATFKAGLAFIIVVPVVSLLNILIRVKCCSA